MTCPLRRHLPLGGLEVILEALDRKGGMLPSAGGSCPREATEGRGSQLRRMVAMHAYSPSAPAGIHSPPRGANLEGWDVTLSDSDVGSTGL